MSWIQQETVCYGLEMRKLTRSDLNRGCRQPTRLMSSNPEWSVPPYVERTILLWVIIKSLQSKPTSRYRQALTNR